MCIFWLMFCTVCKLENVEISTECGHHFHLKCFPTQQCHLPCVACQTPLGQACFDAKTNTWFIGIKNGDSICSCYKLVESKIVPHMEILGKWSRTHNGRLQSRKYIPVQFNIRVT